MHYRWLAPGEPALWVHTVRSIEDIFVRGSSCTLAALPPIYHNWDDLGPVDTGRYCGCIFVGSSSKWNRISSLEQKSRRSAGRFFRVGRSAGRVRLPREGHLLSLRSTVLVSTTSHTRLRRTCLIEKVDSETVLTLKLGPALLAWGLL